MSEFKKEFPSLSRPYPNDKWYNWVEISKHCVDKQRVKEAIDKVREYIPEDLMFWVEKELGL